MDAIFSTDGSAADASALHDICRRNDALLVIDEAHSVGVIGPTGRGIAATAGIAGEPDVVRTVTLSKALGSQGGAVLGSTAIVDHLVNTARTFIFDTGLAPACVGAALAAIGILATERQLVTRVHEVRDAIADAIGVTAPEGAVVSLVLGDPAVTVRVADACQRRGCSRRLLPAAFGPGERQSVAAHGAGDSHRRGDQGSHDSRSRGDRTEPMKRLVITGTGTEIGKTIVTAAIAALARDNGQRVAVVKAAQTGIEPGDESDIEVVTRLSGVDDVHELVRYPAPLAPASAARLANLSATPVAELGKRVEAITDRDLVLIEGAGGLLVRFDEDGATMAELAAALEADVLVVAPAGLGTLNATALTCNELRRRSLTCAGVVIGSWPAEPDLASRTNLVDLPVVRRRPVLGGAARRASPRQSTRLPRGSEEGACT